MSTILSLLGIAVTAAGVAAIGFGIPINEFTLGTTLIVAGVSAFTGGLVLIGLATVVAELGRLREAMRARPITRSAAPSADAQELAQTAAAPVALATPGLMAGARAAQAASTRPKPEAPQVRPVEPRAPATSGVDTSRAEPSEPSIVADEEEVTLSPSGAALPQTQRPRTLEPAPAEPKVSTEDRVGGAAVEALKASRLDFLFRSKPARPASQRENFGAPWPAGKRAETEASQALEADQHQSDHEAAVEDRRAQQAADEQPRAAAILKSGVVDGMAYTLYADGSIEAKLPHGTVKFGSIAELRAHIETNS